MHRWRSTARSRMFWSVDCKISGCRSALGTPPPSMSSGVKNRWRASIPMLIAKQAVRRAPRHCGWPRRKVRAAVRLSPSSEICTACDERTCVGLRQCRRLGGIPRRERFRRCRAGILALQPLLARRQHVASIPRVTVPLVSRRLLGPVPLAQDAARFKDSADKRRNASRLPWIHGSLHRPPIR